MAKLSAALEEYLKTLPAETQTVLRPLCEANPGLGEGWLRQNDYDRLMDEGKIAKKEADEATKKANDWYNDNLPKYNAVLAENETYKTRVTGLETENKDLNERIAKVASGAGDDMTQEQMTQLKKSIMDEVGTRGYVSQKELEAIALQKTKELVTSQYDEARKKFFTEDFPAATQFIADMTDIMAEHRSEFSEKLDRKAFAEFMQTNKLVNPNEAYKQYVADRRLQTKIEAARKEGLEAGKKEALNGQVPGSGVTPGAPDSLGHLQLRLTNQPAGDNKPVIPPDVEVGTGALASLAAQELRAEGKV